MFASAKGKNKSRFDSYSVTGTVYPILPFGIVERTLFPTTFLKIAVYVNTPRFLICTVWSVPLV